MASTISAARSALYDLLVGASWPGDDPQVTFGMPAAYEEQEVVALGGVEAPQEQPAVMGGPRPRDETFIILLEFKVHDPAATTGEEVDVRCWALMDTARALVYANNHLSGALPSPGWAAIQSQTSDGALAAEGGGWVQFGTLRVACRARIA